MRAARFWFPALFLLAAVSASVFAQKGSAPGTIWPKNPKAMLAMARQNYDFNGAGVQPWHFKGRYQLFDPSGQPTEHGTLDYWWASPKVYRATWIQNDGTLIEWHTADGRQLTVASGADIRYFVEKIPQELLNPVPETAAFRRERLQREMVSFGKAKCPCVRAYSDPGPSGNQWLNRSMYCFDPAIPVLLVKDESVGIEDQYGDFLSFQGRSIPRSLTRMVDGRKLLTATVETVGALDPGDPDMKPPAGAKTGGMAYQAPPGVIHAVDPQVSVGAVRHPWHAVVIFEVKIGRNGDVEQMDLINRPEATLVEPARKAMAQWKFKPTVIDGKAVAVRTTIELEIRPRD